jgi:hypothetical protein
MSGGGDDRFGVGGRCVRDNLAGFTYFAIYQGFVCFPASKMPLKKQ